MKYKSTNWNLTDFMIYDDLYLLYIYENYSIIQIF